MKPKALLLSGGINHDYFASSAALADSQVLLTTPTTQDECDQVLAWAHHYGEGRVVYSALGHDAASINQAAHSELLPRSARWCGRIQ